MKLIKAFRGNVKVWRCLGDDRVHVPATVQMDSKCVHVYARSSHFCISLITPKADAVA